MEKKMTYSQLKMYLIEDIERGINTNLFSIFRHSHGSPSHNAVYLIRMAQFFNGRRPSLICKFYVNRLIKRYGIFINASTSIGKGLFIPHPNGIIIGKAVSIGDNCSIFQQVTIGGGNMGDSVKSNQPKIEDNCIFFAGSKVLGDIHLASYTTVGANAVLKTDTVEHGVYAGVPARLIKKENLDAEQN